jgi:hypothetical protein
MCEKRVPRVLESLMSVTTVAVIQDEFNPPRTCSIFLPGILHSPGQDLGSHLGTRQSAIDMKRELAR